MLLNNKSLTFLGLIPNNHNTTAPVHYLANYVPKLAGFGPRTISGQGQSRYLQSVGHLSGQLTSSKASGNLRSFQWRTTIMQHLLSLIPGVVLARSGGAGGR